jgi:hypothetical protein
MSESSRFIQVGFTALRDPATGGFLPAVPLYIEATPEAKAAEGAMIKDISRVFADRMKQYIEGGGIIERQANGRKKKAR